MNADTMSQWNIFDEDMFENDDTKTVYENIQGLLVCTGDVVNEDMTDDDIATVCANASKYISLLWKKEKRFFPDDAMKSLAYSMYHFIVTHKAMFRDCDVETTVEDISDGLLFAGIDNAA